MDNTILLKIINNIIDEIIQNKDLLNDLDRAIGDADHGSNMARGFSEVQNKFETLKTLDPTSILKTIAMTLISTVGGASGPLYGTAFLKASGSLKGKENLTKEDYIKLSEDVIEGIKHRGQSDRGCKTMLDAIIPAYEAFKSSLENNNDLNTSLSMAEEAAFNGVDYTKTIIATKGRASYLGERSIGHADPGATSSYIIIKTISNTLKV